MRTTAIVVVVLLVAAAPLIAGVAGASSHTEDADQTKVDVVVVFDNSESTNEDRYHMAQEIDALANRFEGDGIDAQYGLVTYNETARVALPLTADFDSFEKAMHFTEAGNEEHASDAILTATDMSFRDDAEKYVVVVTDEDDDSSNATRDDALSTVSDFNFVAVSPSSPTESSCSVHSPPCDNRTDNELRTMAEKTDGDWIAESQDAETIVDSLADIVLSTGDTESETVTRTYSSPSFTTIDHSANRTTAEVGDPVRFNQTVENRGTADGTYDAYLSHEGTIIAEQTVSIPDGESRTTTFVHQFDQPGEYEILITHEVIATVTVTEPLNETINTTTPTNGTGVSATVSDAWTNASVSIPVNDSGLAPDDVASIENVVVSVGDVNVTPAHDVAFDFEVLTNETPPNGTEPMSEHVTEVSYLTLDSSLGAALDGVQFEYVPSVDETTLYRYDGENETWIPLDGTTVNATDTMVRTEASNATVYAVGVRQPSISVTDLELEASSIDAGESTTASVTISNDGTAAGTFEATLRLDGSVVGTEQITVDADSTQTITFDVSPEAPGQYSVGVEGGPSTTLQVDEPPTTTTTTETVSTTTESNRSLTAIPGFGIGVAIVAILGVTLLAHRRT